MSITQKRDPYALYFDGKDHEGQSAVSLTQQQFMPETDVSQIMAQILRTGITPTGTRQMQFNDLTALPDYKEAMDTIATANSLFASLPAATRDEFKNDPRNMMAFIDEDKNYDRAIELGLISPDRALARSESIKNEELAKASSKKSTPPAASKEVD